MLMHFVLIALAMMAGPSPVAKGAFHFGQVRFTPIDSLAFQIPAAEAGKTMTLIALTDFKIDRPAVIEAIDAGNALVTQAFNAQGNVVIVRLTAPDRCGVGGFLSKGSKQIDLGTFPTKTSVGLSRVAGECFTNKPEKMFDDVYDFRLVYDAPLTAIPKPTTLGAGGGEPGATYIALVKAIQAADWKGAQ